MITILSAILKRTFFQKTINYPKSKIIFVFEYLWAGLPNPTRTYYSESEKL